MAINEKNARGMAKGAFTRVRNILLNHIQSGVENNTVLASKNQMDDQFSKLEEAHLNYLEAAQVDFDENQDEANYLNHPNQDWNDARKMYGDFLKERKQLKVNIERMAKFKTKQKILEASIMNFGTPAENITNLIKEGISSTDVRAESNRFEEIAQK